MVGANFSLPDHVNLVICLNRTETWPSMLQLTRIILVVTKHDENCSKMSRLSDVLDCILIINRKRDEIIVAFNMPSCWRILAHYLFR
jgi:hypothetical protein